MRIRFAVESWILENDTAAVRAVRTIQKFIILFIIYNIIYYIIFVIYYSSDSPSSLITESLSVTQSLLHTRRVSRITVKALVTSNII